MKKISVLAAMALIISLSNSAWASTVDDQDCKDFASQADAQAHYNADKSDPDGLDADGDGQACENYTGPWKSEEVPHVAVNTDNCEELSAVVTNVPEWVEKVRFQFGHDEVKFVDVSEQDTAANFELNPAPEGGWGFSVRLIGDGKDTSIFEREVIIQKCAQSNATRTLGVTGFSCSSVDVEGTGWEQTNATVELAIPPAEGGESRDDLLVIKQVFPTEDGVIKATLDFPKTPPPGKYAVVVLIDNIQQDPQAGFEIQNCTNSGQLPFTGLPLVPGLAVGFFMVAAGAFLVRRGSVRRSL